MADETPVVLHAAWLMWCFKEGYTDAGDRAMLSNWLLDDPTTLHPDDARLRSQLIAMAQELLTMLRQDRGEPS